MAIQLFWRHPLGDTTTLPCVHLTQQHPNGDSINVPCTHAWVQQHSNDGVVFGQPVPCIHWGVPHPNGHTTSVPCVHIVQQHPNGDPAPNIPCLHPMTPVRYEASGNLIFFTSNTLIQHGVINAVSRLNALGVNILAPRPLNIFHRPPVNASNNDDLFWSHYDPLTHSLQVTDDSRSDEEKLETLRHEMGHALLGHSIVNHYAGGNHQLTSESSLALAMSEGWAHFVALAISKERGAPMPVYKGRNWETMSIAPNPKIEYCVGCCLWDLFDNRAEAGGNPDAISISFAELFRVYSPSLQTLASGPVVSSIFDFLNRLKLNNQGNTALLARIDEVRRRNVGNP